MMPYLVLGLIAVLAGLIARATALRFWGGFFLQLLVTVLTFPLIGPLCLFPGMLFILMLSRWQSNARRADPRACPFSEQVRDECRHYHEELCQADPNEREKSECGCGASGKLHKKGFFSRHKNALLVLLAAFFGALLLEVLEDDGKKKATPPIHAPLM